jgi:hypothetical protein
MLAGKLPAWARAFEGITLDTDASLIRIGTTALAFAPDGLLIKAQRQPFARTR